MLAGGALAGLLDLGIVNLYNKTGVAMAANEVGLFHFRIHL